jgi:two-component system cell cycle sensor histidine kinase/response regulator CckA
VAAVARRTVAICKTTFDRGVLLVLEEPGDAQLVRADPSQIEQALLNVLINARDALAQAAPRDPRVLLRIEGCRRSPDSGGPPRDFVCIRVSDNGSGMDDSTRVRIFEPFFTTKPVGSGTGLGLSTTVTIVREHGGSVEVESTPGQGSTFSIYLPRAPTEAPERRRRSSRPAPGGGETILVVDDEKSVRDVVRRMLERGGYGVQLASDGREALRLLARDRGRSSVDLVLLDVSMPGLSGRAILGEMKALAPSIPVAYFTGYGLECPDEVDGLIEKPVTSVALLRSVRTILDRRPARRARA